MFMRAFTAAAVVVASLVAPFASAEEWVAKMFPEKEHNFGIVAKGADTVFKFPVKNIYKQDIEIVSVRSSCGCTMPTIENKLLKTGDTGYIVASFNTRTFTGVHGATLTVDVKWNDNGIMRRGETQLRVNGNIRGDVVFKPGAITFDGIDQGAKAEQRVSVAYAGRSTWRITDVRGASDDLEVELVEKERSGNRITYDLLVRVKDSAPAGYFNEQLVLITNDDQSPRIPIHVAGKVVPQISASPEPLLLGNVIKGEQVTKRVIVRGKKPFKIVSVECPDQDSFKFNTDDKVSDRHLVEIVFDAKGDSGIVKETIHISTDLGESYNATVTAYATVVDDAPAATTATDSGAAAGEVGDGTAATATTVSKQVAGQ
jgi:hypothetical protein